uniref:hypothetical protein n=1 Tax=Gemmiger formicilis TaxID=745368 RepID=UPI0040259A9F
MKKLFCVALATVVLSISCCTAAFASEHPEADTPSPHFITCCDRPSIERRAMEQHFFPEGGGKCQMVRKAWFRYCNHCGASDFDEIISISGGCGEYH